MIKKSEPLGLIEKKYYRAQSLMQGFWKRTIVPNSTVYPVWIEGSNCFWYERDINLEKNIRDNDQPIGSWDKEYRLVNANDATNTIAFDHSVLAAGLAESVGMEIAKHQLPIARVEMVLGPDMQVREVLFDAFNESWAFQAKKKMVRKLKDAKKSRAMLVSPDGKYGAFVRDHNLWVEELATGDCTALTYDGEESFSYGALGNGWGHDMPSDSILQALWSTDSRQIFTLQRDCRLVLTTPVVEHVPADGSIRPKLRFSKVALPGDANVPDYRLLSVDIVTGRGQPANYQHVPVVRNSYGFFDASLGWWGADNQTAYFVDLQRDYKNVRVVEFNTKNGATRILFEESAETHINLMLNADEYPTIFPLPDTQELIWFSERSGWGHLYLYDLTTGLLKNPITSGDWVVRDILAVDVSRREVFIQTMGRRASVDPYYRDVIRVELDTGKSTTILAGDYDVTGFSALHDNFHAFYARWVGNRDIGKSRSCSHSGDFFVGTISRSNSVPESLLLDRDGKEIMAIEAGNLATLKARVSQSWHWPEPVKLLAADQRTELYGLVYRPSDFDPNKSYPIIDYAMNTPDMPSVPKGSFSNDSCYGAAYLEAAAMAELGFIVIQIDGRGTPYRQKSLQDECYGCIESASNLEDHIAGIRQLGLRCCYMDLDRVGIYCGMGGAGGVQGLLLHPEFYKVGALAMPMHDSRLMPASMWGDMFEGVSGANSGNRYPEEYAQNLQGKLLMCQGMLDDGTTPPAITFRMVEALQKANKDFDLLMLPNVGHSKNSYMIRRIWDYFIRHLQEIEPPKEFKLTTARDL